MKNYGLSLLIFLMFSASPLFAQNKNGQYKAVDEFVNTLGSLNTLNVARIADTLTRKLADKEQKARALVYKMIGHYSANWWY